MVVFNCDIFVGRSVGLAVEGLLGVDRGLKGVADAADDLSACWRAGVWLLDKGLEADIGGFMLAGLTYECCVLRYERTGIERGFLE